MTPRLQVREKLVGAAAEGVRRASDYLLNLQHPDGYWWGELTADTTLESDYICLLYTSDAADE